MSLTTGLLQQVSYQLEREEINSFPFSILSFCNHLPNYKNNTGLYNILSTSLTTGLQLTWTRLHSVSKLFKLQQSHIT